ncbi:MAG: 1,4-beta-xylanase [Paenibacillaceae bacterium]|nr:MAG: 1,4-beta-xylanase [Paenibacillaceae bacterium]
MRSRLRKHLASLLALVMLIPGGFAVPLTASAADDPVVVYHETFESGIGKTEQSGGASLQHATGVYFDGNDDGGALYVTNRTNPWDAADYSVSSVPLQTGNTYTVTASVYADPADLQELDKLTIVAAVVTTDDQYRQQKSVELEPGKPATLTETFTVEDHDKAFRIQTDANGKEIPYYIGEIKFILTGTGGPEKPGQKVVLSQSFEDGDYTGWSRKSWGGQGTLEVSGDVASDGSKSLKFTNRESADSQPLLNLTGVMKPGRTYDVSLNVRLGAGSGQFHIASKINSPLLDNQYPWLVGNQDVTANDWTTFAAKGVEIPADTSEVLLWIESAESNTLTSDIYIDEVLIVDVTSGGEDPGDVDKSGIFDDFESGIGNWVRRFGAGGIEVTQEDNHTEGGKHSLKTTASAQYDGPLLDVRGKMARGHQYELSAWVKMARGEEPTVIRISVQYGENSFANVSPDVTVTDGEWVKLSGTYTQSVTPGEYLNAYVEVANDYGGPRTFLIDDFELKYIGPVAGPNPDFSLPAIKDIYKDHFLIGSIMNPGNFDDEIRSKMLKHHYNLLTAENAMKPEYAYKQGSREFDLTDEIALAEQAIANGFKVHGHVLVWHAQSPNWLHTQVDASGNPLRDADGNILYLDREEALNNLRTHIRTVVETIGDRVISWDVVNEAMNDNPPNPEDWRDSLRRSGWYYAIGPDYLYEAFKTAREVIDQNGWDIELYYNDYNDDNQNKATAIANMVKELNERYAAETNSGKKLIDGIGMQAHYNLNTNPDNVRASIERIIGLGLKVGVTELDIMAGSNGTITEDQAIRQGYLYAQLFQLYKEYADHITRVTFWGVDDGTSWRSENSPLLFDGRYQAKPAYYAVMDPAKFIEEHPPAEKEYQEGTASYGTPAVDGTEDTVWSRAEELPITRFQTAHNGATGTARVLWDDRNLYVLIKVQDTVLDQTSDLPYEQDSVEVFLDETNSKAPSYGPGIGQYRVNYENAATFNPESIAEGFESAVVVNGTNYTVEMKIPFKTITPANGSKIGFDAQINDAKDGVRQSVAIWNDLTGQGWQDPSVFGVLTLTGKPQSGGGPSPTPPASAPEPDVAEDGTVTVKPTIANGRAKASLGSGTLSQALELAAADDNGRKIVVLDIDAEDAEAVDVELPAGFLAGDEPYVIRLKTPLGIVDLPSNMLAGIAEDAETITISISGADDLELDEAVRNRIGDRPAISLNVLADGEAIAWNNPNAPVTVYIPYEPTAEELANPDHLVVWYIDDDGRATAVPNGRYDAESGAVVFRTTHFSVYAVAHVVKTFDDIDRVAWAKQAIEAMASRDMIDGSGGSNFDPHDFVTRAEFAALLVRVLELQDTGKTVAMFSDVAKTDEFYDEVRIAKQHGFVSGNLLNRFNPNSPINRQDMMVMVDLALRAAGRPLPEGGSLLRFKDAGDVAAYARSSAEKLVAAGIVQGAGGTLNPGNRLTRAEAAVILYRIWAH